MSEKSVQLKTAKLQLAECRKRLSAYRKQLRMENRKHIRLKRYNEKYANRIEILKRQIPIKQQSGETIKKYRSQNIQLRATLRKLVSINRQLHNEIKQLNRRQPIDKRKTANIDFTQYEQYIDGKDYPDIIAPIRIKLYESGFGTDRTCKTLEVLNSVFKWKDNKPASGETCLNP
jgi:hypothetical protein